MAAYSSAAELVQVFCLIFISGFCPYPFNRTASESLDQCFGAEGIIQSGQKQRRMGVIQVEPLHLHDISNQAQGTISCTFSSASSSSSTSMTEITKFIAEPPVPVDF